MQFPASREIHRACSKAPGRYATDCVALKGDRLWATDGRILADIRVEREEGDEDGLIPAHIAKLATTRGIQNTATIEANGVARARTREGFIEAPRPSEDVRVFPRCSAVMDAALRDNLADGSITIGLNAKLLHALVQALGSEGPVALVLPPLSSDNWRKGQLTSPILVRLPDTPLDSARGVIMPITVD